MIQRFSWWESSCNIVAAEIGLVRRYGQVGFDPSLISCQKSLMNNTDFAPRKGTNTAQFTLA